MFIFASDLDNTLIHSKENIKTDNICVEYKDEKEITFMSIRSYNLFNKILEKNILFIPVTTRALEQYNRINLFKSYVPRYSLISNGGILLKNGKIDNNWLNKTFFYIKECKDEIRKAYSFLELDKERAFEIRYVDNLFLFTKSNNPEKTSNKLKEVLNMSLISVIYNGAKLYVIPKILDKGFAIKRIKEEIKCDKIFVAGDSIFDVPMLECSDILCTLENMKKYISKNSNCYYCKDKEMDFSEYLLEKVNYEIDRYFLTRKL